MKPAPFSAKLARKRLDALCREFVLKRDQHTCQKCGRQDNVQHWAHIFSCRHLGVRWSINPPNSLDLCVGCHLFWCHKDPLAFAVWVKGWLGTKNYNKLIKKSQQPFFMNPVSVENIEKELKGTK